MQPSAARAADRIGLHAFSIDRWLNGTCTGDNETVAADAETVRDSVLRLPVAASKDLLLQGKMSDL